MPMDSFLRRPWMDSKNPGDKSSPNPQTRTSWGVHVRMTPIIQFCKTTSIKGVPKILTSNEKHIKILWALAVTAFLSIAVYQTHSLLSKFLRFNTVLRSQRHYYSETKSFDTHWFPSMTICDLQYSWLDVHGSLIAYMTEVGIPQGFNSMYETAWKEHFNNSLELDDMYPTHFVNMETLGKESLLLKALPGTIFIPYCRLLVSGLFKKHISCKNFVTFNTLPVFDYQTCIRVDLNPEKAEELLRGHGYAVYGIELLLFASRQTGDNRASGGVIYHHNIDTQPNVFLDRSALRVAPGRQYTIQHEETLITRKNTTTQTCAYPGQEYLDVSDRQVNYTTTTCIDHCIAQIFYEKCRCLFRGQIIPQTIPANTKYCGHVWDGEKVTLKPEFLCMVNNSAVLSMCYGKCNQPCEERVFDVQVSSADWPSEGTIWEFLKEVRKDNPNFMSQYREDEHRRLEKTNATLAKHYANEARARMQLHYYIVDSITRGNTFLVYEEVYEMTWENLIGQLGGLLNLYAGITVVIVIELLEIVIRYCMREEEKPIDVVT